MIRDGYPFRKGKYDASTMVTIPSKMENYNTQDLPNVSLLAHESETSD